MDKHKMEMERKKNYKKWFDRWLKTYDLKKEIEIANNKNYTCLNINVHQIKDERNKLMMMDHEFINMLEEELECFNIYRQKEIKGRYLLGNKIGEVACNTVYIDWS